MSNPQRDAITGQREEAAFVTRFMASDGDLWAWLHARLEGQRRKLVSLLATVGGTLTHDDRLIIIGKLALVEETLARPSALLAVAEAVEKQLRPEPYVPGHAPIGSPGPV